MPLKSSRSTRSRLSEQPSRRARASSRVSTESNMRRFGRPVSGSWSASSRMRSSASLRSVWSKHTPARRSGRPSAPRTSSPRLASQRIDPSGRRTRNSVSSGPRPAAVASTSLAILSRSSGWISSRTAFQQGRTWPGSTASRRYNLSDQYTASVARSSSQSPMPPASWARRSRPSLWRRASSARRRSSTSMTDPTYPRKAPSSP